MNEPGFSVAVGKIRKKDSRYDPEAYLFVREALDFAGKMLKKPSTGPQRHISGTELLEGIRIFALQEFGPMSLTVFREWGVKTTQDFGEIVFNLVESGILGKTDTDSRKDFTEGYDFFEVFAKPFLPAAKSAEPPPVKRKTSRKRGPRSRGKA